MSHLIHELSKLDIIREDRLEEYYPRVRDRDDVAVLRDPVSEVVVLSRSDHVAERYYEERIEKDSYAVHGENIATPRLEDDQRRAEQFGAYVRNKRWLDFGCGLGGMLDALATHALSAVGLEPNKQRAALVAGKGHRVVSNLNELESTPLDVVTMFHVLEHLTDPLGVLAGVRSRMKPGGLLLVEVPHARDALLTVYECEAFKKFTFWSEHLVLHTRHSLKVLLERSHFKDVEVVGHQRYPLYNHLHWLARQRPGGHENWRFLGSLGLHVEYENSLARIDRTDTLIAIAWS